MKKYVLTAILAGIIGVVANPGILSASNDVVIKDITGATETVLISQFSEINASFSLPAETLVPVFESVTTTPRTASVSTGAASEQNVGAAAPANSITSVSVSSEPMAAAQNIVTPVAQNYIQVVGKTLEIQMVKSTAVDAGTHVNAINKLLYGHNTTAVFGGLRKLQVGDTFIVARDGATTTYRVAEITTYEKSALNQTVKISDNHYGSVMSQIKNTALGHDVALMTCAGTVYSNGDATHRLVILADKI